MEPQTINRVLLHTVDNAPREDKFIVRKGGRVETVSTADFFAMVREAAAILIALGAEGGDRVALVSENRLEWSVLDFAILAAGCVNVPLYPSLTGPRLRSMIEDAGAKIVVVSGGRLAEKIKDGTGDSSVMIAFDDCGTPEVQSLKDLKKKYGGETLDENSFRDLLMKAKPGDLSTLYYTSGTTGEPKGVMLTHRNLTSDIVGCMPVIKVRNDDLLLSALPLCHSFQRMVDFVFFYGGASICHVPNPGRLMDYMKTVEPTVMASVPRFQEKMYDGIRKGIGKSGPVIGTIGKWSLKTAGDWAEKNLKGRFAPMAKIKRNIADGLFLKQLRKSLGGRFRYFISGGGPLSAETARLFYGMGIPIVEGYGLTETSPVVCLNDGNIRPGTVGKPIENAEVKLEEDGELLVRGPMIMEGYYKKPEETAAVMKDGWLKTGDLAKIDEEGRVSIVGRKKELIILTNGKNIYPAAIENRLVRIEGIEQAAVFGDGEKFLSALIVPNIDYLKEPEGSDENISADELLRSPAVKEFMDEILESVNRNLLDYEKIKKYELISEGFTRENCCLTPTLKIRRNKVRELYKDVIEGFYGR